MRAIGAGATVLGRSWLGADMGYLARLCARVMVALGLLVPILGGGVFLILSTVTDIPWWQGVVWFVIGFICVAPFLAYATIVWHLAVIAEQLRR